ncbi:CelD/BcsL family acetyltransferase involved in cellulose biosynthesis [Roseiarcus fermentans]|uniref:CelD/BcsL family acetyltransferase involved in cellulose biosynthesis n=1 Tax=Roseiarcus fermentans TaxID=1473586 RepID=A0A366EXJ2_9HYPH|nr:GNAT family N-acetyltransferase [Roseiarcus fermentans]RBP07122.1 CelD/BcsL family acetyltransferase involved in cellulose biosynthesis [Roseiarcus fermentans]
MVLRKQDTLCKGDWSIHVHNDLSAFSGYWPAATSVTPARRYVFQCADVLDVWLRTIGRRRKFSPQLVAVLDSGGSPLLLLPLCLEQRHGSTVLKFIDGDVSDYNAPIVFPAARDWDAAKVEVLWEDLKKRLPAFDLALLEKMPTVVEDWPNPMRFLSTGAYSENGHWMTLPADWDAAEKSILPDPSGSRRRTRKLAALGEVSFSVARTEEEAQAYLKALMEMKGAQFRRTLGYDRFVHEIGYAHYYVQATQSMFRNGSVNVSALAVNATIVAANWGYVVGERFYGLMSSYRGDPEWKPYAPGRLLNEFQMKWGSRQGLKTFDLGVGDEPYKVRYAHVHVPLREACLPMTVKGLMLVLARSAKNQAAASLEGTQLKESLKEAVRGARVLLHR